MGRSVTANLGSIRPALDELAAIGWDPGVWQPDAYQRIATATGLRPSSWPLAFVATDIARDEHPLTLRGLFYRVVSAGVLPNTDAAHYQRLGRIMRTLRLAGVVPFQWIVDSSRATTKPSSWSGLGDFADTVRDCYRRDFWASLPEYAHVIVEKDALAGTIEPVCEGYDVALSPIRGYASISFAYELASSWLAIEKPIFVYYLGDFDPSGFDLERSLREQLEDFGAVVNWERLAVLPNDFDAFDLRPLAVKQTDRRWRSFVEQHGQHCVEVDALPPTELRTRVTQAIERHIPADEWARLQVVEEAERAQWRNMCSRMKGVG
jgi:hypothetical protein